jgi:hypothetical protein
MSALPSPTIAHRHANRGHRHSVRALFGATSITDADRRSRAMVESPQQWISPREWASYSPTAQPITSHEHHLDH